MAEFWMKYFGTKPNYRLICFDITSPADLAKVEAEPRAQIATDLSEYLKG